MNTIAAIKDEEIICAECAEQDDAYLVDGKLSGSEWYGTFSYYEMSGADESCATCGRGWKPVGETVIYRDEQDPRNVGWAYRTKNENPLEEETGEVNGIASDALDAISAGEAPTAAQLAALKSEFPTATLENVGEIFPGE